MPLTGPRVGSVPEGITNPPIDDLLGQVSSKYALVIYAAVPGITQADAQRLVAARASAPLRNLADAAKLLGGDEGVGGGLAAVASRYFEVRGRLRLDSTVVEERSLVQRDGSIVRTLQRQYAVLDTRAIPPNR
ncbi:MAG: DNA-directed RNA polymerase subunit omega [Pseudomonadota bacterium]